MSDPEAPKDGNFASYLENMSRQPKAKAPDTSAERAPDGDADAPQASTPKEGQTIEDVIVDGQEPTDELLEELRDLENALPLSDEELARQALEDGGEDGDPRTPE
jgi:hypothetical protein